MNNHHPKNLRNYVQAQPELPLDVPQATAVKPNWTIVLLVFSLFLTLGAVLGVVICKIAGG